jgi:hypothetical protein
VPDTHTLLEKIQALPAERIAEIWNNPEDDDYDAL